MKRDHRARRLKGRVRRRSKRTIQARTVRIHDPHRRSGEHQLATVRRPPRPPRRPALHRSHTDPPRPPSIRGHEHDPAPTAWLNRQQPIPARKRSSRRRDHDEQRQQTDTQAGEGSVTTSPRTRWQRSASFPRSWPARPWPCLRSAWSRTPCGCAASDAIGRRGVRCRRLRRQPRSGSARMRRHRGGRCTPACRPCRPSHRSRSGGDGERDARTPRHWPRRRERRPGAGGER